MSLIEQSKPETKTILDPEQSQIIFRRGCFAGCGSTIVLIGSAAALAGEVFIPGVKQLVGETGVIATSGVVFISGVISIVSGISLRRLYHRDTLRMEADRKNNNSSSSGVS